MELIAGSAMLLNAELRSGDYLSVLLNAWVTDGWPPETWMPAAEEFLARIEKHPGLAGWLNWYWVLVEDDKRTLIGSGGFTGAPFNGEVMVGYSVLKTYQRRGFGSEAVNALANWAFARPGVQRIVAETGHTNKASIRLLEKCGFEYAGKGFERGTIRFVMPKEKWLLSIK
jgi:RimJ/RimL family protein N-acetyltransferase